MNLYNRCKTLFVISIIYLVLWIMAFVPAIIYAFSMAFAGFMTMFAYQKDALWWTIEKPLAVFTCIIYLASFLSTLIGMILCRIYVSDMNKHTVTQNTESVGKAGSIICLITFGLAGFLIVSNIIMLVIYFLV